VSLTSARRAGQVAEAKERGGFADRIDGSRERILT